MEDKKAKSEVNYSKGMPSAHCSLCEHFIMSRSECRKVQGVISPAMWCKLFEKAE